MSKNKPVCLLDMDGTLCDYDSAMRRDLQLLSSPDEKTDYTNMDFHKAEKYPWIKRRMDLIKGNGEWWEKLPKHKLGFDIYDLTRALGFRHMILTQGPKRNYEAWSHKLRWVHYNLPELLDVTITRDKGLVYGKVLVDDYPPYVESWLEHRPRGLVIMPANHHNCSFKHEQVIRYTGDNFNEVHNALCNIVKEYGSEE